MTIKKNASKRKGYPLRNSLDRLKRAGLDNESKLPSQATFSPQKRAIWKQTLRGARGLLSPFPLPGIPHLEGPFSVGDEMRSASEGFKASQRASKTASRIP